MKVLIVGAGKAGAYLAGKLHTDHAVTVIDQRQATLDRLRAWAPDVHLVHGDACEPAMLDHAGLAGADLVVAVTGDDEDNLVVSWLAKTRGGVANVIARVNHPANTWLFSEMWGVDCALSPPALIASEVLDRIAASDPGRDDGAPVA
ncbi:MAG: TrkA family potassium uptake protein [Actinobacteria bacterium]|nr:MAG: TrkA family potassium uptake protein [Actinomycetota bacterium]